MEIKVSKCSDCPFMVVNTSSITVKCTKAEPEEGYSITEGPGKNIEDNRTIPEWCPQLKQEAVFKWPTSVGIVF